MDSVDDADRSVLLFILVIASVAMGALWIAVEVNLYLGAFLGFLLIFTLMERYSAS